MYWPDTGTGVDTEPARKPVASAVRKYFTEGGASVPPTVPGGDWFNAITNEVLNVLAAAGIDPSKTDDDQLLLAIQRISKAMSAREALRRTYAEAGFNLVPGSFELGGTVTTATDVLLYEADGHAYNWDGVFPGGGKVVPQGSTPASTGGVGPGLWLDQAQTTLRAIIESINGPGIIGFDSTLAYAPASIGYRLANSIDITDAPYNARPNQTDISAAFLAAAATGRPIYFPEPKNPANYYRISGLVAVSENLTIHGPRSAKIVFDGVAEGEDHIRFTGRELLLAGLTLESTVRGLIARAEPIDSDGIDSVTCTRTKFKGGLYSIRSGGTVDDPVPFPVKRVTIHGAESEAPVGQNAGHFLSFNCGRVRYIDCSVKYGKNTSAYGAARCKDIVIDGCSEEGVSQTVTAVEAAAQIEDSEGCLGKIVNCNFEHDIWVSSSSGVKVRGNSCRELRVSTGSQYSSFEMDDIVFSENSAGRINVQKYGSYPNTQRASVDFIENTLDPESHSNLGSPFTSSYILDGSVCSLVRLRGNKNISDAATNAMQITRDAGLRLEVDDLNRFGIRPHLVSGSGGRILSDISLEDAVPGQGTTTVADILLGFTSDLTPTATGNFANIPFTNLAKNINLEYVSVSVQPIEDCIYHISGQITVDSPSDGVRLAAQIYNETDNLVLLTLVDTRLWTGVNSVPLLGATIKLLAGKVYRLRYVTGNSACSIKSGLANTGIALKALI